MEVRQTSLQIWKTVVSNTPRTLVEIMAILLQQLVDKLSSSSEEMQSVAGRAMGELVQKVCAMFTSPSTISAATVPNILSIRFMFSLATRFSQQLFHTCKLDCEVTRRVCDWVSAVAWRRSLQHALVSKPRTMSMC